MRIKHRESVGRGFAFDCEVLEVITRGSGAPSSEGPGFCPSIVCGGQQQGPAAVKRIRWFLWTWVASFIIIIIIEVNVGCRICRCGQI